MSMVFRWSLIALLGCLATCDVTVGSAEEAVSVQHDFLPGPTTTKESSAISDNGRTVTPSEPVAACGAKQYCRDMTTCAEAYFYMSACGLTDLDRRLRRNSLRDRLREDAGGNASSNKAHPFTPSVGVATESQGTAGHAQALMSPAGVTGETSTSFDCKVRKTTCKQMDLRRGDVLSHYLQSITARRQPRWHSLQRIVSIRPFCDEAASGCSRCRSFFDCAI